MLDFPDKARFLARYEKPAPSMTADGFSRVRWLRQMVRPYAGDLAAWEYSGEELIPCSEAELLLAAIGLAERHSLPRDEAIIAAKSEWRDAKARMGKFANELRRTIWQLGHERAPGAQIMAEAHAVNDRRGTVLPTELLEDATRRIAHAAAGGRRHVRR